MKKSLIIPLILSSMTMAICTGAYFLGKFTFGALDGDNVVIADGHVNACGNRDR